jgi:hypothetical protein
VGGGDQCHFCAFFTDGRSREVDGQDIYETVREAIREPGRFSEIYLSGGTDFSGDPPFAAEAERYIRVLQAVGRNFSGRFSSQLMAPAYPKTLLRRIYDQTGVTSYCPNIEVWDAAIFKELPGKEKCGGLAKIWVSRTLDAVEIFGKGQVCTRWWAARAGRPKTALPTVTGLKSNYEGCESSPGTGVSTQRSLAPTRLPAGVPGPCSVDYYIRLAKGPRDRRDYGLTHQRRIQHGEPPDSDLER